METYKGIQGNDLGHSNNVKDWAIRRLEPKSAMIGYGSVSETAKASVINDGLINPRLLKVQSTRRRKSVDFSRPIGAVLHTLTKRESLGFVLTNKYKLNFSKITTKLLF